VPGTTEEGDNIMQDHDCAAAGKTWWREYDAQGIYLCRVCEECVEAKLARYRPEILSGYTQADVDEPIEADEWAS
jgi:peptide methionine sulfoxide reductase MsrB